jgi:hypothetical protein
MPYDHPQYVSPEEEVVDRLAYQLALADHGRVVDPVEIDELWLDARDVFGWHGAGFQEFLSEELGFRRDQYARLWRPLAANRRKGSYTPSDEEVLIANRTARASGAVGRKALVPRIVAEMVPKSKKILDFGAGPQAIHTQALRSKGHKVTAHDFGRNVTKLHNPEALYNKFDVVFGSNVINVQSSEAMLDWTLDQMARTLMPGGKLIVNYPASPRKAPISTAEMRDKLLEHFPNVERVGGTGSAPVWMACCR